MTRVIWKDETRLCCSTTRRATASALNEVPSGLTRLARSHDCGSHGVNVVDVCTSCYCDTCGTRSQPCTTVTRRAGWRTVAPSIASPRHEHAARHPMAAPSNSAASALHCQETACAVLRLRCSGVQDAPASSLIVPSAMRRKTSSSVACWAAGSFELRHVAWLKPRTCVRDQSGAVEIPSGLSTWNLDSEWLPCGQTPQDTNYEYKHQGRAQPFRRRPECFHLCIIKRRTHLTTDRSSTLVCSGIDRTQRLGAAKPPSRHVAAALKECAPGCRGRQSLGWSWSS